MHESDDSTEVDANAAVVTLKSMSKEALTAIEGWEQGDGSVTATQPEEKKEEKEEDTEEEDEDGDDDDDDDEPEE